MNEAREVGCCVLWKGAYGLIRPRLGPPDIFCSYRSLEMGGSTRLELGQHVTFVRGVDATGRACAEAVRVEEAS